MIMSNEEKDKYIRETLSKDKYVFSGNDSYKEVVSSDIETSNIKPSLLTFKQKISIIAIVILLIIAFLLGKFVSTQENNTENNILSNNKESVPTSIENNVKTKQTTNTNTSNDAKIDINSYKNEEDNELEELLKTIDKEKLEEELKIYSLGIGRFDKVLNSREENTILLLLAMDYFSELNKYNTDGVNVSNKYSLLSNDANDFIEELTGIRNSKILDSYNNYIGYSDARKAYILGKDENPFTSEEYTVLNCNYSLPSNSEDFIVSGQIEKSVNEKNKYIYKYDAKIIKNQENYQYFPYKIKEFSYKIEEGNDEVFRLVDKTDEIEPDSTKKN